MTGSYAGGGEMEMKGFCLANELYPTVLGRPVALVVGDSKSHKTEATNAASSLVDKGVVAVLGSYCSGLTLAGADVFAQAEIPASRPPPPTP